MKRPSSEHREGSLRRSTFYVAAIVGLGMFLALVLALPAPIVGYVARGVVEQRVVQGTSEESPVLVESQVREIAEQVFQADRTSGDWPRFGEWTKLDEIVRIQGTRTTADRVRFEIYCRDRIADRAEGLCGKIAKETVDRQPATINPRSTQVQSQHDQTTARLAGLNAEIRKLEDDLATLDRDRAAMLVDRNEAPVVDPAPAIDPAVQATLDQLAELEHERRTLAAVRTDAHPQIVELDHAIAALRGRIGDRNPALSFSPEPATQSNDARLKAFEARYLVQSDELRTRLRERQANRDRLEAELNRLAVPPRPIVLRTEIIEPVRIVERVGGSPGPLRLTAYCAIACGFALAVSLLGPRDRKRYAILEAAQCEALLRLPIAAELPEVPAAIPAPHWNEKARRFAVSAGEFTIAASLVVLTFHLVRSQGLTVPVANDPFGAVAEAIDRASESHRLR